MENIYQQIDRIREERRNIQKLDYLRQQIDNIYDAQKKNEQTVGELFCPVIHQGHHLKDVRDQYPTT